MSVIEIKSYPTTHIVVRDFLDSSEPKRQKLNEGGKAESYADLIDAYQKGIDVMPDETLTQYIRRVRMAELENAYRGMD